MTDFGYSDGYVGIMKGVMMGISRDISIVDICHEAPKFHTSSAAYILWTYFRQFPKGTVHCVVVDPGVGSDRKCICVSCDGYYFVLPDNGILSLVVADAGGKYEARSVSNPEYTLAAISNTFHGRDVFAPCAAKLATGASFKSTGSILSTIDLSVPAAPCFTKSVLTGTILHIDSFGNYITNIPLSCMERFEGAAVFIVAGNFSIIGVSRTFSDRSPGDLVAYFGSTGLLEIGAVKSSAVNMIGMSVGDTVTIAGKEGRRR